MQMPRWQQQIVRGFSRLHTGLVRLVGGRGIVARNILVLVTRGRKTGRDVTAALLYVREGERLYIVASFGGHDVPPHWYRNLVADPAVRVEVDGTTGRYRARPLTPEEAKPIWPRLLAMYPAYASYQKKTARVIPVVELAPA
jgi:deazaflavin-dependent oxidoreductase (nitroreductase family)